MPNFTVSFQAMGSQMQVWLTVPHITNASVLQVVPSWFERWEMIFSRFRLESELSSLNRHNGEPVKVSATMFEVVTLAVEAARATNGIFNPLILTALEVSGYDHSFEKESFVPGSTFIQDGNGPNIADWHDIKLNRVNQTIQLPLYSRLDLGGIVKGWAAQHAADRLAVFGPCLVDAGGDIVAHSSPDNSGGWLIKLANPISETHDYTILLKDAAVATSGTDYRTWVVNGERKHHLIDPRTAKPATSNIVSASVVAPTGAQAEIWAKTALIIGESPAFPTALIYQNGSAVVNSKFEDLCKKLQPSEIQ